MAIIYAKNAFSRISFFKKHLLHKLIKKIGIALFAKPVSIREKFPSIIGS
jgi:hypothetical protein